MKSVLLSVQPKWCEKIAQKIKKIEVRKTRPKLETPFKCYIYESLGGYNLCNKCDKKTIATDIDQMHGVTKVGAKLSASLFAKKQFACKHMKRQTQNT